MTMELKIELYDRYWYNDNWYVPTGEFRAPYKGEVFLDVHDYSVFEAMTNTNIDNYAILKREKWRTSKGFEYFYLDLSIRTVVLATELGSNIDDNNYEVGNYFRSREEAEKALNKIKELLNGLSR